MKSLRDCRRIYLVGICGTAMASLAGMLKESGYEVIGSDQNVYPPMSTELADLGIEVLSGYDEKHLDWNPDLVIIGNALSRGNPEVERTLEEGIRYTSLPEVVCEFFIRGRIPIVVCGTHGKTTTTSMLAWIFETAGLDPSFLIGGIAQNFGRSYRLGKGSHFIIEGDEYDTAFFDKGPKFLHYLPHTVLLNNIEYDHADIYPSLDAVKVSFRRLLNIIPRNGLLVANLDDLAVREMTSPAFCDVQGFTLGTSNLSSSHSRRMFRASDIKAGSEGTRFEVADGDNPIGEVTIPLFGDFNVANALGAVCTSVRHGIAFDAVSNALRNFKSVRRRMEIRGIEAGVVVVDDFAHHPTAIKQTLQGLRMQFPRARVWAIVEPRSATMRRNVVEQSLISSLCEADEVVLAEVFSSARIPSDQRLSPERVVEGLKRLGRPARFLRTAREIVQACTPELRPGDVIAVFSNGGFDNIHAQFLQALKEERVRA